MMTIFIRQKFDRKKHLPSCPFCQADDFEDVSNEEFPHMFKCKKCGKISAVEFDADTIKSDCVYLNKSGLCWSKGKPKCSNCLDYRVE